MTNFSDRKDLLSKNLILMVIFWLGVLTGAIAALLFMQAVSTAELKSNLFYTPIKYSMPGTYKPGPDPWMPTTGF
jgi:hypothetical protein